MSQRTPLSDVIKDSGIESGNIAPQKVSINYPVKQTQHTSKKSDPDLKSRTTSDKDPLTGDFGVRAPEPTNSKKLYGANIDVLETLNVIEFNSYADGALRQNIAYIKFYGDSTTSPNVIDPLAFSATPPDSELQKCFDLKDSKECQYSVASDIKLTPFSTSTLETTPPNEEVGKSLLETLPTNYISELRFTDGFNENANYQIYDGDTKFVSSADPFKTYETDISTLKLSLPSEVAEVLPDAPSLKTLLQSGKNGIDVIQDYRNKASEAKATLEEYLNKTPSQAQSIVDAIRRGIDVIDGFSNSVDKYLRIGSSVLNTTGQVIETWDQIRSFFDRRNNDLDIPLTEPLFGLEDLDIPLSEPLDVFQNLDIPITGSVLDEIFSADINGSGSSRVEKISTYSCKEVLSKKDGIWQFLFNPSQLTYNYNSDYATSDVWATPDGKPLHWKGNNNPELQFNDVILNGYMFGRKVEYLAQGLKDLMGFNNTKTYQGSPPVLEFVWGSKRFGPCVMKDLTITEDIWDGGELVSATCNFTLEMVPEWVVNDGQVDIFDPSKTPVFIPRDPILNEEVEQTEGVDEVVGDATQGDDAKDDIVTLEKPGNVPTNGPSNNSPSCKKISYYLKEMEFIRATTPQVISIMKSLKLFGVKSQAEWEPIKKYLKQTKYVNLYRSMDKITKELGINLKYPNGNTYFLETFLNIKKNNKCDFRKFTSDESVESYGMRTVNIDKPTKLVNPRNWIVFALECRLRLIEFILQEYNNNCTSSAPNTPPVVITDNSLCGIVKAHENGARDINSQISGIGGIPGVPLYLSGFLKFLSNIPLINLTRFAISKLFRETPISNSKIPIDGFSNIHSAYNYVYVMGLYSSSASKLLNSRKDLINFKNERELSLNAQVNVFGKTMSCTQAVKFIRDLTAPNSQGQNLRVSNTTISLNQLDEIVRSVQNKCVLKMNNIGNKYKKQLNCTN